MSFSYYLIGDFERTNSHGFGRVPDLHNHEWKENGKWFAECMQGGCTGFVEREDEE